MGHSSYYDDSIWKRIAKCLLSGFLAALFGVVVSEVVANSLIEISVTPIFSGVFGGAFVLLGVAIIYRSISSLNGAATRGFMIFFASLVFASGAFCFLLQEKWEPKPLKDARLKSGMYAIVGLSLSFALSFSFTEFITMGLCDKCCKTDFQNHPIISTKKQVGMIFFATALLGTAQGLLFGLIDVEDDNQKHDKFTENLLVSLPLGGTVGFITGFLNQWFRSSPESDYTTWSSKVPIINADDEI